MSRTALILAAATLALLTACPDESGSGRDATVADIMADAPAAPDTGPPDDATPDAAPQPDAGDTTIPPEDTTEPGDTTIPPEDTTEPGDTTPPPEDTTLPGDVDEPGDTTQPDTATPQECEQEQTTDLAGVTIEVTEPTCVWTLQEAQAGIEISYQVVVAEDVPGVIPLPQDAGQCDQPGPSGLILFEELAGGDQSYCICDSGLCMGPDMDPVTLKQGEYETTFTWDGVNWYGPSDTGNPKGDPFPPGSYTLTLSAEGVLGNEDGPPFTIQTTCPIVLVEDE